MNLSIWVLSVLGLFTSFDSETVRVATDFEWNQGDKAVSMLGQALGDPSGLWPQAFEANYTDDNLLFVHDTAIFSPIFYR